MSMNNANEIMEGLVKSKNIYNLLANLYFLCSKEFITIYNFLQEDSNRRKFHSYLQNFKKELEPLSQDIFTTDFQKVIKILKRVKGASGKDCLIIAWSFLRAIDLTISNDRAFLKKMEAIWCDVSEPFGIKRYRFLFKPKNLILNMIKNKLPDHKLKSGIHIGQRIEDRLQNIIMYEELPGRKIRFGTIDKEVNELLNEQGKNLAFAVAPISCNYDYSFKRFDSSEGVPYVFDEIKNRQEIKALIDALLRRCIREDVHIVVFPELTIDGPLREYLSGWLRDNNTARKIIMVIAGSYHMLENEGKEKYVNSSMIYRFDGRELWKQEKMHQFQLDEEDISELRTSTGSGLQNFKNLFNVTDLKGWEHIQISDTLVLYDSPVGRMAVAICLDFIVRENMKLLLEPHANIIFVPAMSASLKKMEIANKHLGTFGAASIFCANSCWLLTGGEKKNLNFDHTSYIYLPYKGRLRRLKCHSDCNCLQCTLEIIRISEI
ncbi:MAG: nitrilase-related carbon-nitrogen hydrolase [Candidatus Omnitrophota bacterium]